MFLQQDYPNKELVIVHNTERDIPAIDLPANVRIVRTLTKIIGTKRNEACHHAQGSIIAHWDDDDMYSTNRLSTQAAPIIGRQAHITGLRNIVFYEAPTGDSWVPTEMLFENIFVANVHGGSLVYHKDVWRHAATYPNWSLGEDAGFLKRAMKAGAVLQEQDGRDSFVYVRHNSNTWKFKENNFRRFVGWKPATLPSWAVPMAPFYTRMAKQKLRPLTGAYVNGR